jgi:thioredoxin-dependent peroxiredoxin
MPSTGSTGWLGSASSPPPVGSSSTTDASSLATNTPNAPPPRRSAATWLFLGLLGVGALCCIALIVYRARIPNGADEYGLVPTGDVAVDAKAFLAAARGQTTTKPTDNPLAQQVPSPLVGKTAPDFELIDTDGHRVSLHDLRHDGPVVVVFYYGYYCSHCVAQLFALEEDLPKFAKAGAHVVALSADPPETTAARFKQYGRFHFPVLSDRANKVAEQFGVYTRARGDHEEDLKHGTFVIDSSGRIVWGVAGDRPFVDNQYLLSLLAQKSARAGSTTAP